MQDVELVNSQNDDAVEEPLIPVPRFPTTLTDAAFEETYHIKRQRGRSSVSIAESQMSLLRPDGTSEVDLRRRAPGIQDYTQIR